MAKEEFRKWVSTALYLAAIIFAGGGYAMQTNSNTKAISCEREERVYTDKEIIAKAEETNKTITDMKIDQQRELAFKQAIAQTLGEIKSSVDDSKKDILQMKLDINATKIKVETLTKD